MFGLFANVCRTENLAFILCKIGRESQIEQNKTKPFAEGWRVKKDPGERLLSVSRRNSSWFSGTCQAEAALCRVPTHPTTGARAEVLTTSAVEACEALAGQALAGQALRRGSCQDNHLQRPEAGGCLARDAAARRTHTRPGSAVAAAGNAPSALDPRPRTPEPADPPAAYLWAHLCSLRGPFCSRRPAIWGAVEKGAAGRQ